MAIPTTGIEGVFAVKIYLAFAGSGNLDLCDLAKVARMLISYKYDQKNLKAVERADISRYMAPGNFTRGILDPGRWK